MRTEIACGINSYTDVAENLLFVRCIDKVTYVVMVMEFTVITALCSKSEAGRMLYKPLRSRSKEFRVLIISAVLIVSIGFHYAEHSSELSIEFVARIERSLLD